MKLTAIVVLVLVSVFAATARADDTPASWSKAVVYLPKAAEPTTIDRIPIDRKFTVVIYLHGCSGLTGGGATSTGEDGLWDHAIRTTCLDGDGVAAEVIFAQGSVPFAA